MGQITIENALYKLNQQQLISSELEDLDPVTYLGILDYIRTEIAQRNADEFGGILATKGAKIKLRGLIEMNLNRYVGRNRISIPQSVDRSDLLERLYNDMAGFGVISPLLTDEAVEEINVNDWKTIQVKSSNGDYILDHGFASSEECESILRKMMRVGGVILDQQHPEGDSDLGGNGIRISAKIPPCIDKEVGGIASIRKQKKSSVTRETMEKGGTATPKMFSLLGDCMNSLISVCYCGQTGSGKTADMEVSLSEIDDSTRIYTIEDSRELMLYKYGEDGRLTNDVIQTQTVDNAGVTQETLLHGALRFDPEIIVPSEMRMPEAALTAVESANTGHGVVTSIHANSAPLCYNRILTLCMKAPRNNLSEDMMLSEVVAAFPIIAFAKKLKDGSRKIMEIFEGEDVYFDVAARKYKVKGQMLFKYEIERMERDPENPGKITKVVGKHTQKNPISVALADRMWTEGIPEERIRWYQTVED